jgi:hypothetical protein
MSAPFSVAGSRLRSRSRSLADILGIHAQASAAIHAKPRLPLNPTDEQRQAADAARRQELATLREQTAAELGRFRADVAADLEEALGDYHRTMGEAAPKTDVEALLREQREARFWDRVKPLLDRESTADGVRRALEAHAAQALARGNDDGARALLVEAGSYVAARFDPMLAGDVTRQLEDTFAAARPHFAAALGARREAEAGAATLLQNAEFAAGAVASGLDRIALRGAFGEAAAEVALGPDTREPGNVVAQSNAMALSIAAKRAAAGLE